MIWVQLGHGPHLETQAPHTRETLVPRGCLLLTSEDAGILPAMQSLGQSPDLRGAVWGQGSTSQGRQVVKMGRVGTDLGASEKSLEPRD